MRDKEQERKDFKKLNPELKDRMVELAIKKYGKEQLIRVIDLDSYCIDHNIDLFQLKLNDYGNVILLTFDKNNKPKKWIVNDGEHHLKSTLDVLETLVCIKQQKEHK